MLLVLQNGSSVGSGCWLTCSDGAHSQEKEHPEDNKTIVFSSSGLPKGPKVLFPELLSNLKLCNIISENDSFHTSHLWACEYCSLLRMFQIFSFFWMVLVMYFKEWSIPVLAVQDFMQYLRFFLDPLVVPITWYRMAHKGDHVQSVPREHTEFRLSNPQGNVLLSR